MLSVYWEHPIIKKKGAVKYRLQKDYQSTLNHAIFICGVLTLTGVLLGRFHL